MKKFIKINLIILVIVYLSCFLPLNKIFATSEMNFEFLTIPEEVLEEAEEMVGDENVSGEEEVETEDEEKTLDDLQLEKNELELEQAMQLFEEGLQLALSCEQSLKSFENKAASLLKSYQEAQS